MIAERTLAISVENVSMVSIHSHANAIKDLKETDAKPVRSSNINPISLNHLKLRAIMDKVMYL